MPLKLQHNIMKEGTFYGASHHHICAAAKLGTLKVVAFELHISQMWPKKLQNPRSNAMHFTSANTFLSCIARNGSASG